MIPRLPRHHRRLSKSTRPRERGRSLRTSNQGEWKPVRATPEVFPRRREPALTRRSRKEVIQPQVPLRLPCYDLVPITELILGACLLAVDTATWDAPRFRGLTGGVYKAQEHIHRSIADLRLLAIPTSRSRVADSDPHLDRLLAIGSPSRACDALYRPL